MVRARWKLKHYLANHGLTPYQLLRHAELAPNTVYAMARGESRAVRLETLEAVVRSLRELTGEQVGDADLLEVEGEVAEPHAAPLEDPMLHLLREAGPSKVVEGRGKPRGSRVRLKGGASASEMVVRERDEGERRG